MQRILVLLPVVLLATFAALTFWLDRQMQQADSLRGLKAKNDADYMVDNLSVLEFGPDGRPKHTLTARRMVHYPGDDTTFLESPRFVSASKGGTLTVTARQAKLSSDGENVYLSEDVVLVRGGARGKNELRVTTSYLHVIPGKNLAKTDQTAEISDANIRATAVGLEFDGDARILKLLSNVRSTYVKSGSRR